MKFVFVDKGNSTSLPPAFSGSTSASSRLPDEGPRPQGSSQLQPRGGATTSREIPLPQLPTSGLQFGALSTSSQASRLGGLTFTAPPLRQPSPPVSPPQPLLPGGGRGSEAEPPPASGFSPVFHASSSQVWALGSANFTSKKIINIQLILTSSLSLSLSFLPLLSYRAVAKCVRTALLAMSLVKTPRLK